MTDDVTVAVDGVTVSKTYESERFPVPAIAFDVASERDQSVALAITDDVPEAFPMDRIGFHPDYESENWTAYQDHRVRYERELDAGESVTTVYGVRLDDDEDPDAFLDEPSVEVTPVDEAAGGDDASIDEDTDDADEAVVDDIVPSETTGVVRDALADDESVPGLDADVGSTPEDAVADAGDDSAATGDASDDTAVTGDVDEPALDASELAADADASADADDAIGDDAGTDDAKAANAPGTGVDDAAVASDDAPTGVGGEAALDATAADAADEDRSVAEALAAEVREGDVSDDDLDALRDALGAPSDTADAGDADARRSVDVRLEHLQGRVSDVEAYADALEAFIDGDGTARDVLEDVRADLEAVESRTDALERDVETLDREFESFRERVEDDLERLHDDLDDLDDRVADAEDGDDRVEDVRDDVDALEDDIEELRQWRDQLTDVFGG